MNVVLIGARGTGKSAVAKELAAILKRDAISSDAEIVRRIGMPIKDYVDAHGWDAFRAVESEVVAELSARDGIVIDTGGGAVTRPQNIEALRSNGTIFWLQASVETILSRIQHDTNRPSLTGTKSFTEEIAEVLAARTPLYTQAAHHTVTTDARTPRQIAENIAATIQ
ncbi:MAG TPA: shikimate kinase [Candidatus Hydrogenedentes bacterium]|nr:shikimate kinase [Candidatus Hydrogenedentota bacterium]